MTKDPEELFENLAKECPELMEKSQIGEHIGVGAGWFNIISALCRRIYGPVSHAKYRLQAATEYPRNDGGEYLNKTKQDLETAISELPSIVQIKEKFGTLRFYYEGGNDRVSTLVEFAETMSGCTCEECGSPGELRQGGWVRTLCDTHAQKNSDKENQSSIEEGTVLAKIEDPENL